MKSIHEWRLDELMDPNRVGNQGDIDWVALKRAMGNARVRMDNGLYNRIEAKIGPLVDNWVEEAMRENPNMGQAGVMDLRKKILQNLLAVSLKLVMGDDVVQGRTADLNKIRRFDLGASRTPQQNPTQGVDQV